MASTNNININIDVVFFAALREKLSSEGLTLELPTTQGDTTVQGVITELVNKYPHWQSALTDTSLLIAVNHDMVDESHNVNTGDEVAFFPPVTGG